MKNNRVPDGWAIKNLEKLGNFKNGINKNKEDFGYGYPFVNLMDVFGGNELRVKRFGLINSSPKERKEYNLLKGDILFIRSSVKPIGVGLTSLVIEDLKDTIYSGFLIRFRSNNNEIDFGFKRYCFYESGFRKELLKKSTISANTNINQESLKNLVLLLPPLPEQKKIYEILSAWDIAIEKTEQIIINKEVLKNGLMHQLLTGKKRFNKFVQTYKKQNTNYGSIPNDWDYIPILKIAKQISLKNNDKNKLTVLSCTKYNGLVDSLKYFKKQIYSKDTSTYKLVKRNQFAYATNHIEEGSIGYQDMFDEALISPMYTVFETNGDIDDSFLYKLLKTGLYRHIFQVSTSASVDRRGSLRWKEFSKIKIPFPSLDEQKAISQVLVTSENEIKLLTQKLEALKKQKKGLMQQLLTGKIRVKT